MDKLIFTSTHPGAGKTCLIIGLMKCLGKSFGYLKPFGNKLRYFKKRIWDYDSALITNVFSLNEEPDDMSLGLEHAKLRYTYDASSVKAKVQEAIAKVSQDKDVLIMESGSDLNYGASVHLDALALAQYSSGKLVIVVNGTDDTILDDLYFIKRYVKVRTPLAGVIINQVQDIDDFKNTYLKEIKALELNVLGVLPYMAKLTYVPVSFLAEHLFAKVLAGAEGLKRTVKNIFIGASSATSALKSPLFKKDNKLIITSGDRSDMILAALESDTSGVILTNNITPPSSIVSRAAERSIPLLLVPWDTFDTARRLDRLEPLLTKDDTEKINYWQKLVKEHLDINRLINGK